MSTKSAQEQPRGGALTCDRLAGTESITPSLGNPYSQSRRFALLLCSLRTRLRCTRLERRDHIEDVGCEPTLFSDRRVHDI